MNSNINIIVNGGFPPIVNLDQKNIKAKLSTKNYGETKSIIDIKKIMENVKKNKENT